MNDNDHENRIIDELVLSIESGAYIDAMADSKFVPLINHSRVIEAINKKRYNK